MDRVFKHKVDEVGVGLYEFVQLLEVPKLAPFLLVEDIEVDLAGIKFHILALGCQISLLLSDFFIAFFKLLLLFLQRSDFFVDLLLHHLIQVLLLNFELFHDTAEGLFQTVNLVVELLANLELELRV